MLYQFLLSVSKTFGDYYSNLPSGNERLIYKHILHITSMQCRFCNYIYHQSSRQCLSVKQQGKVIGLSYRLRCSKDVSSLHDRDQPKVLCLCNWLYAHVLNPQVITNLLLLIECPHISCIYIVMNPLYFHH